jgi:hypothetical protein
VFGVLRVAQWHGAGIEICVCVCDRVHVTVAGAVVRMVYMCVSV